MSLAGKEARAVECEENNGGGRMEGWGYKESRRVGWGGVSLCLLMRCGFGGFSGSICWPVLPTCRQLVTACQSSRRGALLSLLTWWSKKKREGKVHRKGVFQASCVWVFFFFFLGDEM